MTNNFQLILLDFHTQKHTYTGIIYLSAMNRIHVMKIIYFLSWGPFYNRSFGHVWQGSATGNMLYIEEQDKCSVKVGLAGECAQWIGLQPPLKCRR